MLAVPKAIIVGVGGQDGSLLKKSLEKLEYEVIGITRDSLIRGVNKEPFSISCLDAVESLIYLSQPAEVYYLAAHHSSSERDSGSNHPENYQPFHQVHVEGFLNFLWAIYRYSKESRIFYASSSLVFDGSDGPYQNESTPFSPVGFYGLTKMQGVYLCRQFRNMYGIHASSGILYSHESALRHDIFLSKKLIVAAHKISLGQLEGVQVGSLQSQNDWGYAPDYIEAFQAITRLEKSDDFIVATGETHSVAEFAQIVFNCFGLDASKHVQETPSLLNRITPRKMGDTSKLFHAVGWKPKQSFQVMVETLVKEYLNAISETKIL